MSNPYQSSSTVNEPLDESGSKGKRLKRIGPLSAGKSAAAVLLVFSLIVFVPYTLYTSWVDYSYLNRFGAVDSDFLSSILVYCGYMFVVFPLIIGAASFVCAALLAFIFNVLTRFLGGIELRFED